jgi:hypothetical protein
MTAAVFASLFVPAAVAACALGVAAYRLCRSEGPRCWRCQAPTDAQGAPCPACRAAIHAERKLRMARCVDGRTGLPVAR